MPLAKDLKDELKVKAAYYYYKKGMKLTEIAELLGVSRVTLNRLLKAALDEGIVRIEILDRGNTLGLLDLEEQVRERFALKAVKLVDALPGSTSGTAEIARAAAELVDGMMHSGIRISISWGKTLELMVHYLRGDHYITDVKVCTLLGAQGIVNMQMQPSTIAYNILQKYAGTGYIMNAPFMCDTEEECRIIMNSTNISSIVEQARESDITLVGIGPTPNEFLRQDDMRYSKEVVRELQDSNVCGDICSNFYDIYGTPFESPLSRRFVRVDLNELDRHKCVIGIGGGKHKISSILGALNGHHLDMLVTDKDTIIEVMRTADVLGK